MIELEFPSEEAIEEKIKNKESFLVVKISGNMELMKYCFKIVKIIQDNHMSCRVKTKGSMVVGLPFVFIPVGWVYYGSQAIQILFTLNPDWKIIRNIFTKKIEVVYCKPETKGGSGIYP
jgi:hypothetical protein